MEAACISEAPIATSTPSRGRPQTVTPLSNKARSISTSSFCGTNKALSIVRYPPPCDVTNRSQWVASLRPSPITQHVRQWGVSTEETRQMAIGSTIGIWRNPQDRPSVTEGDGQRPWCRAAWLGLTDVLEEPTIHVRAVNSWSLCTRLHGDWHRRQSSSCSRRFDRPQCPHLLERPVQLLTEIWFVRLPKWRRKGRWTAAFQTRMVAQKPITTALRGACLLECDAVTSDEWLPTFRSLLRRTVKRSVLTALTGAERRRHYVLSKRRGSLT